MAQLRQQTADLPLCRQIPLNFQRISLDLEGWFYVKLCGRCRIAQECVRCRKKVSAKRLPGETTVEDNDIFGPSLPCMTKKIYVCLFIYMASSYCHLEIMQDRTTKSFLQAIKKMTNLMSTPLSIQSDL